ncbi:hypothetical protein [Algoriphagus sp.]|uniref:hypothetical protein n=1 Tax=Algoriphagus sp. TaxID=1872435 RepID=UPI00391B8D36
MKRMLFLILFGISTLAEGFYHDPKKVVDRIKVNKGKEILLPQGAKRIGKLKHKTPTLIFCAREDKTTKTEDSLAFSKRNQVTIIEFDGGHLEGMNVLKKNEYGDEYLKTIIGFLDKNGV